MRSDPESFALRENMVAAGHKLLDVLERIDSHEFPFAAPTDVSDRAGFLLAFTDAVAGTGSGIVDGAVRRAAIRTAVTLVEKRPQLLSGTVDPAESSSDEIDDAILCLLFLLLFPDIVGEFVLSGILEGAELATQSAVEQELSEDVASWITRKIRTLVPNPCHLDLGSPRRHRTVDQVARNLVETAVDRVLGIEDGEVDRDQFADIPLQLRPQPAHPAVGPDLEEDLPREHP